MMTGGPRLFFIIKNRKPNKEFENILSMATKIMKSEYPERIYDLIYSLGKPYQFEIINKCIKGNPISQDNWYYYEHLFFKSCYDKYRLIKEDNNGALLNYTSFTEEKYLDPSNHLIFAFPWHQNRLSDAFENIGEKVDNKWKHDPFNHKTTLLYPLNIGYVTNGHHSSAMNIINNEAPMRITQILDLTPIYDEIYTDGNCFRRNSDHKFVDEVTSVEFAAIFEIGRLILKNPVSNTIA